MTRFDWNEYLRLAVSMLPSKKSFFTQEDEARCRCTVSRAYYAAYHIAADFAMSHLSYTRPQGKDDHLALALFYSGEFDRTQDDVYFNIAEDLKEMKAQRKKADYQAGIKVGHSEAEYCIETAQAVIEDIANL